MKILQKVLSAVLAVVVIAAAVLFFYQEEKNCCLCNRSRYHAPCLIDLETGKLIELDLYFPHPSKVAELADPQPENSTFSFVRLGNATGIKLTDEKRIELTIPASEKTAFPMLCRNCRKQLNGIFVGRYVLAHLYDISGIALIPIDNDLSILLRCYQIITLEDGQGVWKMTIQGILPS